MTVPCILVQGSSACLVFLLSSPCSGRLGLVSSRPRFGVPRARRGVAPCARQHQQTKQTKQTIANQDRQTPNQRVLQVKSLPAAVAAVAARAPCEAAAPPPQREAAPEHCKSATKHRQLKTKLTLVAFPKYGLMESSTNGAMGSVG